MLGKLTLGKFTNGNLTLEKFTQIYLPWIIYLKYFARGEFFMSFSVGLYSEFNSDSCVKVLYTKNSIYYKTAYVQIKILPKPKMIYTGMSVTPVKNSRSAP